MDYCTFSSKFQYSNKYMKFKIQVYNMIHAKDANFPAEYLCSVGKEVKVKHGLGIKIHKIPLHIPWKIWIMANFFILFT